MDRFCWLAIVNIMKFVLTSEFRPFSVSRRNGGFSVIYHLDMSIKGKTTYLHFSLKKISRRISPSIQQLQRLFWPLLVTSEIHQSGISWAMSFQIHHTSKSNLFLMNYEKITNKEIVQTLWSYLWWIYGVSNDPIKRKEGELCCSCISKRRMT